MNRRLELVVVLVLTTLLSTAVFGQQAKSSTKTAAKSVTGCLEKGPDANHFVLKDAKGKQYTVTGDTSTLAKHAGNHNVTITGTTVKENGKSVFKMGSATDLKMNSMCK